MCGYPVGAVPSPFECYLALRGLKTLHLRMEASQKNAIAVAQFLEGHPAIEKVTLRYIQQTQLKINGTECYVCMCAGGVSWSEELRTV